MDRLVRFWRYAAGLKFVERRGWKRLGLKKVESVADHSYALIMLAMLVAERRKINVGVAMKLALIHDLEESITGDLTPDDKRILGAKRVRLARNNAIDRLLASLPTGSRGSYRRLWIDLALLRTREAKLVHELDKLEMVLQANEYAKRVGRRAVKDFYQSAYREIKDPFLRRILDSMRLPVARR